MMMFSLGKVAIVTKAGLGLESLIALTRRGCHPTITARSSARRQEALETIRAAIAPVFVRVDFAVADSEDPHSLQWLLISSCLLI